jgi:hypothetical protein
MSYTVKETDINLGLAIATSECKTLIREICFKYDLKVMCTIERTEAVDKKAFLLVRDGWNPIGEVYSKILRDNDDKEFIEYSFYSHFYEKARGKSVDDKHTFRSKKISSLLTTIKKMKAIPSDVIVPMRRHTLQWAENISSFEGKLGLERKSVSDTGFHAIELQAMMEHVLGESPNTNMTATIQDKCKIALDKYKQIDKLNAATREELSRLFSTPFYVVGASQADVLVVGIARCTNTLSASSRSSYDFEMVKPIKQVDNLEEFPELLSVMTMWKSQRESEGKTRNKLLAGLLPTNVSEVNKELDLVIDYDYGNTPYHFVWMMTPCSNPS